MCLLSTGVSLPSQLPLFCFCETVAESRSFLQTASSLSNDITISIKKLTFHQSYFYRSYLVKYCTNVYNSLLCQINVSQKNPCLLQIPKPDSVRRLVNAKARQQTDNFCHGSMSMTFNFSTTDEVWSMTFQSLGLRLRCRLSFNWLMGSIRQRSGQGYRNEWKN